MARHILLIICLFSIFACCSEAAPSLARTPQKRLVKPAVSLESQLYSAIKKGDLPLTKTLLARGANLNQPVKDELLWEAAFWPKFLDSPVNLPMLNLLLGHGAKWDNQLLLGAIRTANPALFDVFLKHGVKINAQYRFYRELQTPLLAYLSIAGSDATFLRFLIIRGADVRAVPQRGKTALQAASSEIGRTAAIKILLAAGAKPLPRDAVLLQRAAEVSDAKLMGQLLSLGVLIPKNSNLLHILALGEVNGGQIAPPTPQQMSSRVECARLLLQKGISPNNFDEEGKTPLLCAVSDGLQSDLVALLLQNGANPLLRSKSHSGTIWDSAQPLPQITKDQLPRRTAQKPSEKDPGEDAKIARERLMTQEESTRTLELLLDAKVPIDLPNEGGETILMLCSHVNRVKSVKFLLSRGAKIEARDAQQATALQHAISGNSPDAALALVEAKADLETRDLMGNTPLINTLRNGVKSMFPVLLERGANVNALNNFGASALLIAVVSQSREAAKALLIKGANPNVQQESGESPLFCAVISGDVALARRLIQAGANEQVRFQKKTMFEWAKTPSYQENMLTGMLKTPKYKQEATAALAEIKRQRREMIALFSP